KEIKKRHDSIEAFTKGGRADQAAKEQAEVKILESYLPQAMSDSELEALVKGVIAELKATDKKAMGAVMKACQAKAAGRADNRALSALVGKLLP
ncbi:GatB/YqeY domain-containing protein, partial [bacterium]|nr:GatB/YqeY domain-containing protein [bacterium]